MEANRGNSHGTAKGVKLFDAIDRFNAWLGGVLCFGLLVLIAIQDFEVMMRYVFNSPTSWAWDINGMIFSGLAFIGGAYALLNGVHVRLDIFYRNFSPKKKAWVELLSFPFVFAALAVVLWQGLDAAWWAFTTHEKAYSQLSPILWPVKLCLPIAALLMLIQSISTYGRIFISRNDPPKETSGEQTGGGVA